MTLADVKAYLRIDYNDDDALLENMMGAARDFIKSAVGSFDRNNPKMWLLFGAVMQEYYENRNLMQDSKQLNAKMNYIYRDLIFQLQTDALLEEGD